MTISQYVNALTMEMLGILPAMAPIEADKMIFVNDLEDVVQQKLIEAKTWYSGDSDELLNLYKVDSMITFHTEPFFWKNRRCFFWATAANELEYKMSHSGFARDMVDTLVSVCGTPIVKCAEPKDQAVLEGIIRANDFWSTYRKRQMPMTLVCGWGALKIDWNARMHKAIPVISFHDGIRVRFHKYGPMVVGMTFFHWYTDGKLHRYLLAETRAKADRDGSYRICYRTFEECAGNLTPCEGIPGVKTPKGWKNMPVPFAVPCSFYADNLHDYEGRGIFEGKIDLLDDLDQTLSQESNTVRRSTPQEVFDLDYCERDPKTKIPKLPKSFERKYVGVRGKRNASGESSGDFPVQVTQPELNVDMYSQHAEDLKRMIISGHLSPSTIGIDVDKRSSSDTLHERNKETVFTRNHLCNEEGTVLIDIFTQALIAHEYLSTGKITKLDYGVSVEFDEFSDVSFEAKVDSLSTAYSSGGMSPEMYVDKLYGKGISAEMREREIAFLREEKAAKSQMAGGMDEDPNAMYALNEDVQND